jgi:hypothetical protein
LLRPSWQTVAKGILGFLAGLAIWWGLTPAWDVAMARAAQPLIRTFEDPAVTRLRPSGREIIIDRQDFPPRSAHPGLPADDLTFNFILLTTLFAANRRAWSTENVWRFLLAAAILYVIHVAAFIAAVESLYALQLGPWSLAHYGPLARNFWGGSSHFYRIIGIYASAFLLWWLLRPHDEAAAVAGPRRKTRKRSRR